MQDDIEEAVEDVLCELDEHELMQPERPLAVSVGFLEVLVRALKNKIHDLKTHKEIDSDEDGEDFDSEIDDEA
jgi:hypothetical protein